MLFSILFCVDSKAELYLLKSTDNVRSDIIYEIKHSVHLLIKGTGVISVGVLQIDFGPTFSERAERAAKRGAINNTQSTLMDVPLSSNEMRSIIKNGMWKGLGFSRSIFLVIHF